ncbi:MAG: protein TolR [Deltaproteobacteria bacterium]|nr:MAG: protein TolR [Deltaproteobacteria bacterium]TNF31410.1 MAG: protein TolR [Deltaproteobacteria bacterium]
MGFSTGKGKGPVSEINVTPLVDVMLVLLVIFMITAPLMLNGIKLELPKTKEVNPINLNTTQVVLSYTRSGEYFIGKDKMILEELVPEINALFKKNSTQTLFLRADYGLTYGKVAKLMSFLKRSGVTNIALVTEMEK